MMIPQGLAAAAPAPADGATPLIRVEGLTKTFTLPSGKELMILKNISLEVREGEVVSLLGPSGCGKSTLMRILTGLIEPSAGTVLAAGRPLHGINPHTAIVFQNFALFPWLTVYENIAVGLDAFALSDDDRKARITHGIDSVGLEGFEEAYPKELSGGMKQRVGLARALVMRPALLCLDEPFSALDVLTAENLIQEVMNLWHDRRADVRSMFLVTHNISEAVALSTRIVIMGANPGHVRVEIHNPLPYPRDERSKEFAELVDRIHAVITKADLPDEIPAPPSIVRPARIEPLPRVETGEIIGMLEILESEHGRVDVFDLGEQTGKEFGRVIAIVKAAELLDLVDTPKQDVVFTDLGRAFMRGDVNARKRQLKQQLQTLRLFQIFTDMLRNADELTLGEDAILEELAILLPNENPERLLDTIVEWGRYAELIGYNADRKEVYLDIGQESI